MAVKLNITAREAGKIHEDSDAMLQQLLDHVEHCIREGALKERKVVITNYCGNTNHFTYTVPMHQQLQLSRASSRILDELRGAGFCGRYMKGETYTTRGSDEVVTPYTLTITW